MSTELFLRNFNVPLFFWKKAVLREYVTEFTFVFPNPFERNGKKYSDVVKKRKIGVRF